MENTWKRNVSIFLASQTLSLFGSSLVQYAITWYITLNTKSGIMMTISIICGFLPTFFLSPFTGVWADRYNRKMLIMLSDSLIAVSTLILAIVFLMGYDAFWMIFLVSAIRAVGSGIQTPAINAYLPQLVPEDKLQKVNATNGTIQSMIMLISPMLSGALLNEAGITPIFFIDVITAALAVTILLLFLKVPYKKGVRDLQNVSYKEDMLMGLKYVRKHEFVREFFVFSGFFMFLAAPVAFLTPLQVARNFGEEVWRLTGIEITFSIGMMAGGILMTQWEGFKNKIYTMTLASVVMGICTFAFGFVNIFWIYLFLMGVFGFVMPFFNTVSTVMLQVNVEEEYLGRVFGVFGMISSALMPLSMLIFGPLADTIALEGILIATGLLLCLEGFMLSTRKALLRVGAPKERMTETPVEGVNEGAIEELIEDPEEGLKEESEEGLEEEPKEV